MIRWIHSLPDFEELWTAVEASSNLRDTLLRLTDFVMQPMQIEPVQPIAAQNRKYDIAAIAAVLLLASFGLYSSLNDRIFGIDDYGVVQKVREVISLLHASVTVICVLPAFYFWWIF